MMVGKQWTAVGGLCVMVGRQALTVGGLHGGMALGGWQFVVGNLRLAAADWKWVVDSWWSAIGGWLMVMSETNSNFLAL